MNVLMIRLLLTTSYFAMSNSIVMFQISINKINILNQIGKIFHARQKLLFPMAVWSPSSLAHLRMALANSNWAKISPPDSVRPPRIPHRNQYPF